MRRTKIVCTLGPSSSGPAELDRLVAAGMDVARINFSHGTHAEHAEVFRLIRAGEARWRRPVAVLQDLQGPKIRLGTFGPAGGRRVDLEPGKRFTLSAGPVEGTAERASLNHPEYLASVRSGDEIWMDDGMIQLRVEEAAVSCLTDKDRHDLRFSLELGVDFVAVSFVRSAADILEVRGFLKELGADVPIVAKLERHEGIANLAAILGAVDAVMVARGDLGVDVPLEDVPHLQKEIVLRAREAKVPVIVATQMLESMVTHLRPTRAEVSDVATAIFDGADAIMLSAETATGRYPAEAVEVMARIAERAERDAVGARGARRPTGEVGFPEALSDAASEAAHALKARAIVAFTQSGFSARLISQARPDVPIIALTPFVEVQRRLALSWGVSSRLIRKVETTEEMIEEAEATLLADGSVRPNDVIVIISGSPMWVAGSTNLLKLQRVGERR
ncbi:MAG: pyruvate kinase [Candidatus Rokubacteria bacterium]|nr:pyruvate kinase [Candidatus Rokubacteria bacterium]